MAQVAQEAAQVAQEAAQVAQEAAQGVQGAEGVAQGAEGALAASEVAALAASEAAALEAAEAAALAASEEAQEGQEAKEDHQEALEVEEALGEGLVEAQGGPCGRGDKLWPCSEVAKFPKKITSPRNQKVFFSAREATAEPASRKGTDWNSCQNIGHNIF